MQAKFDALQQNKVGYLNVWVNIAAVAMDWHPNAQVAGWQNQCHDGCDPCDQTSAGIPVGVSDIDPGEYALDGQRHLRTCQQHGLPQLV